MTDKIVTDLEELKKPSWPTTWEEVDSLSLPERLRAACATSWTRGDRVSRHSDRRALTIRLVLSQRQKLLSP